MSLKSVSAAMAVVALLGLGVAPTKAGGRPLNIEVYNPGASGIFPVSSEIISGNTEVVLIDAQFQRQCAEALVGKIKATGKKLTAIYISHSDPDYYFGLDTLVAAFPGVKVRATPSTVAAIRASKDEKLAYWGPILKDDAPKRIVVPEPLQGDTLAIDGESLRVMGLFGPTPHRTFLWVPSRKAVVGGVLVFANAHVWVADTQTPESRREWVRTLGHIVTLRPTLVVPGHYLPNADGTQPFTVDAVAFTRDYLNAFEAEAGKSADSAALVAAMKSRYPGLADVSSLELSAQVIKGEVQWPAEAVQTRIPIAAGGPSLGAGVSAVGGVTPAVGGGSPTAGGVTPGVGGGSPAASSETPAMGGGSLGVAGGFPAMGKSLEVNFGRTVVRFDFKNEHTMTFIGTAGDFNGVTDTVEYSITEIRPRIFMVYWHEPTTGSNVMQVEDFEKSVVYANIAQRSGEFQHLTGSFRLLDVVGAH